jgi:hypothetical protein
LVYEDAYRVDPHAVEVLERAGIAIEPWPAAPAEPEPAEAPSAR